MMIENDIFNIVGKNQIVLDDVQQGILNDIADKKENIKDVLLWGSHGTGKTIVGAEVAKMKLEQNIHEAKVFERPKPKLILCDFSPRNSMSLLDKLSDEIFDDIEECEIIKLDRTLLDAYIMFVDEMPIYDYIWDYVHVGNYDHIGNYTEYNLQKYKYRNTGVWFDLSKYENLCIIMCLSPVVPFQNQFEVEPPNWPGLYSRQLILPHRNCPEIQEFCDFYAHHNGSNASHTLLTTNNKRVIKDNLPNGELPIWVECDDDEATALVKKVRNEHTEDSIAVLCPSSCKEHNEHGCVSERIMVGLEKDIIILMPRSRCSYYDIELFSRARKKLYILAFPTAIPYENTLNLCVNHQQSDACPDPCTWIMTDTLPDNLIAENFLDEGDWVWIYHKQSPKCQQHNISRTCPCPWINQSLVVKTQKIF